MGASVENLGDLSARQFSYALAGVYRWVLPSDMLELGGELESCQQASSGLRFNICMDHVMLSDLRASPASVVKQDVQTVHG